MLGENQTDDAPENCTYMNRFGNEYSYWDYVELGLAELCEFLAHPADTLF